MASLNQYASRVAHIVGQPDNLSLKERIKDMIKDYFAKYLTQSIDRNGIQPYYKLKLLVNVIAVTSSRKTSTTGIVYYTEYETNTKIPKPLNIKNDAPFTRVCIPDTSKLFAYNTIGSYRMSSTLVPTGNLKVYTYNQDKLTVKIRTSDYNVAHSIFPITQIEIEGVWEEPEKVIGFYGITDNQDLDLPFPNEMLGWVMAEILKTEFNIVPKDIEVDKK